MTTYASLALVFFAATSVLILHLVAYEYHFYWTLWWYDIMMHGLGGFAVGALIMWTTRHVYRLPFSVPEFIIVIVGVLVVGIAWELFEFVIGSQANQSYETYVLDTMIDIAMDVFGGAAAYLAFTRRT